MSGRHEASTGPSPLDPSQLRFLTTGVTPEEIAAVTAVLATAAAEAAAAARDARPQHGPDGWQRSQRGLRKPLTPGPGVWRSFSG
ncbi:acyl-CoA carboxylase epsilon subunit [Leifsonia sp. NPDC056824]|uniref:acyl-CoA carboxylase epsilon subunit n=1 Tax=Leifsonia sp. NPDC056824 TaxID=3345953 RepID=UPI003695EA0D